MRLFYFGIASFWGFLVGALLLVALVARSGGTIDAAPGTGALGLAAGGGLAIGGGWLASRAYSRVPE